MINATGQEHLQPSIDSGCFIGGAGTLQLMLMLKLWKQYLTWQWCGRWTCSQCATQEVAIAMATRFLATGFAL